jgi:hypothetical protein
VTATKSIRKNKKYKKNKIQKAPGPQKKHQKALSMENTPPNSPMKKPNVVPPSPYIDTTNHWNGSNWVFVQKTETHNQ